MSGVEDRIVSMKFDNEAFERKMADTLKSLDKFRQSLDFTNSKRGLEDLGAASRNFSMGDMAGAVEGVSGKFLALTTVAITSLATITTHAVTAAGRMLKSFSLQPIMSGFQEYETNIGSIQTILANTDSKGTTLKNVNAALDELNAYADKTIYNFSQMTKNIGTFTAAGIDLDKSVGAIKGIANLAAISGSSADQASTAMYQLSQALASGTVKLMDWNSIVNAGMGGEVFQKALFESGKALKTIKDVPIGQTFDDWKKAGNSFRGSLEDGWITAEVLTNTLKGFTGDLTEAQILSMGYTKAQAAEIMRLGKVGLAAATEVKTFTQLIDTVKEAVGSGWSTTFRLLIGDFDESKKIFTQLSGAIGDFVGDSSQARNELISGWRDLGGRTTLIEGFKDALQGIWSILSPVSQAFRQIFPRRTAQQLFALTQGFANLAEKLKIGEETADQIRSAFRGLFSVVEIGWTIVKEVFLLLGDVLGNFSGVGGGILDFADRTGDALTMLNHQLVANGGIHDFFMRLREAINAPIEMLERFKNNIKNLFVYFTGSEDVEQALDRIGGRFESLQNATRRLADAWQWLADRLQGVRKVLGAVFGYMTNWFAELGQKLAAVMEPGDFDSAVDIVNVGLLGGITLMLKKFLKNGLSVDFTGGVIDKIKDALEGVTGTLKSMQTQLKAKALMEIAIALGVLTVSIVALSLINSEALTKALVAITVGFGQLLVAMKLMDKIGGMGVAAKIGVLATAMGILAGSMVILSVAVKNLSSLGWEELAKGLGGVTVMLLAMTASTNLIAKDTSGMIRAGIAMAAISVGLLILSEAVKSFSELSWAEMVKGMTGVAIGLGLVTTAMNFMPTNMALTGPGLIAVAVGLRILATAVEAFSGMSLAEMGKGFLGIGAGLAIIATAMTFMPITLPITAAGMVILSSALLIMAGAVAAMGAMKLDTLAKGIGAIGAMLLILTVAMNAMSGALVGAAALVIVSGALLTLSHVLKVLGNLSIAQLVTGLLAIAGVLTVLGVAAFVLQPVIPALLGLGVALGLLGVSFALFGVGAMLVAKAFEVMAKSGKEGAKAVIEALALMMGGMPVILGGFIKGIGELVDELGGALQLLVKALGVILGHLLDTIVDLAPKIGKAILALVVEGLKLIREIFPEVVDTGFELLMMLLKGIRDNAYQLTEAGAAAIVEFLRGIRDNVTMVTNSATDVAIAFIRALGNNALRLAIAGADVLISFLNGLASAIREKSAEIRQAGVNVAFAIIDGITGGFATKAKELSDKAIETVKGAVNGVKNFLGIKSPSKVFVAIGKSSADGLAKGFDDDGPADGAVAMAENIVRAFQETLSDIPNSLDGMDEFNPTITPVLDLTKVQSGARNLDQLMRVASISPSVSFDQARLISTTSEREGTDSPPAQTGPSEVKFEQNIYAPTALTTNDIYRNTKSQIALAKEELNI